MTDIKRHPRVSTVITLEGVVPGQPFVTYEIEGIVIHRGRFTSHPDYSEDDRRWTAGADIIVGE